MQNLAELRSHVPALKWYHEIDLGDGLVTPGYARAPERLNWIRMPQDLSGQTVLDVGAWDGFFSFEAERRGAARVLATDHFCWGAAGRWGTKEGFELARRILGSRVEDRTIDVLDLSPDTVGTFDVVLFLGVLYHMRHPLLALEKMYSVTRKLLILETHVDLVNIRRPAAAYYPDTELNDNPTNWWGPNGAAVEALLKTAGFKRVERVHHGTSWPRRLARALRCRITKGWPVLNTLRQDRLAFHAWRE